MLSDSWSAVRRRPSEGGTLKTGGRTGDPGENQENTHASGIKEEEEDQPRVEGEGENGLANGGSHVSQPLTMCVSDSDECKGGDWLVVSGQ